MNFLRSVLCGILIVATSTMGASGPKFDKKLEKQMYAATGRLYLENPEQPGEWRDICTIWNVAKTADGYEAVTASHCITLADRYTAEESAKTLHFKATYNEPIDGLTPPELNDIRIIAVGSDNTLEDFALIDVKTNQKLPVLKLGNSDDIKNGDKVLNCSVPFGGPIKGIYDGIISATVLRLPDTPEFAGIGGTIVFQSAGPAPGSSGSAVLSVKQGAVIGVLVRDGAIGVLADPVNLLKAFIASHPAE